MNAPSDNAAVLACLSPLARRIRWKRWLGRLHRFTWLLALTIVAMFVADAVLGMRTLSLRIASGLMLATAAAILAMDWVASWLTRLDVVGVAQLLEKKHPELAERLVTLAQLPEKDSSAFTSLLLAETERLIATVEPARACPFAQDRKRWTRTGAFMFVAFVGLCFAPGFGTFAARFFSAWATPLVPFEIELAHGNGYALRGGTYAVEARIHMLDANAEPPGTCELVCQIGAEPGVAKSMKPIADGRFAVVLEDLHEPMNCRVRAGDMASTAFEVHLIDAPTFAARPAIIVTPPAYLGHDGPTTMPLDANGDRPGILRYSTIRFHLPLDRTPLAAQVRVTKPAADSILLAGDATTIAAEIGEYRAEYVLTLEHGLTATLPIGAWTVRDDAPPRFTRGLRLHNGASLSAQREIRIAPSDAVKLQTEIEDAEGLDAVYLEWRVNGVRRPLEKWLPGGGRTSLAVNDWLPLPTGLKEGDRVAFRVHAFDGRRLRKGEVLRESGFFVPPDDLLPQVAIAPPAGGSEPDWFTLRVDRSRDSLVQDEIKTQSGDLRDVILKIKAKVVAESTGVEHLRRTAHQGTMVTPTQAQEAHKLAALNRTIVEDLLHAEQRFADITALAPLAAHFLDIAEVDMKQADDALTRFRTTGRSILAAEKDLETARDHLDEARKKLDRMLEWNNQLAQDRLDQFHLEKLAKQQDDLAQRLQQLLNDPKSKDDTKEIDAIRREQARLADEMAKLQSQSKLMQDALAALEQARIDRLKSAAEQLAADQRTLAAPPPDKMPAELKARMDKLAQLQDDLARRVGPFAEKNQGPDVRPAEAAADALKKPHIDEALALQREHEKRLEQWLGKLLPGVAVNSLREQVLVLWKKQIAARMDLERLGEEFPRLNRETAQERLNDVTRRQKELPPAIAALPIAENDTRLRPAQTQARLSTQRAADRLAVKDALEAFFSMEQAEKDLQALAGLLPATLPIDRADIKDSAMRERIDKVEAFQKEQAKLREATEKLRSDLAKSAGAGPHPLTAKADKLASELMELAQKGGGPEAKAMAKESASAVEKARKAMEASQAMKAKGDPDQAKKMVDEAAGQLALAVKQMAKLAQEAAMKKSPQDLAKTAEAIRKGADEMRKAEANLPAMPKDAQAAMKAAAKNLGQAAKEVSQQMTSRLPQPTRNPPAKSMIPAAGGVPSSLPKELQAELLKARNWGDLSGELKTRMIQDYTTRFGPDHADVIRQYFERLSVAPLKKE